MKQDLSIAEICSQLNFLKDEYEKTTEETKKKGRYKDHLKLKLEGLIKEKENLIKEVNSENKFEK